MRENIYEDAWGRDAEREKGFCWGYLAGVVTMGAIVIGFLMAMPAIARAADCEEGAFGCGHEENHEQYKEWRTNTGASCCNNEDCRPVRARPEGDGQWSIWVPEIKTWVRVPDSAMQKPDKFHDGRAHACTSKPGNFMMPIPYVYCFSPSEPRI